MTEIIENNHPILQTLVFILWLLPLLSFIVCFIIPERYSWLVTLLAPLFLFATAIISVIIFYQQWNEAIVSIRIPWFTIGNHHLDLSIELSNNSVAMLFVVSVISFLVHLYSAGYMAGDSGLRRYYAMLGFFTFSMIGIVNSNNLLVLFIFWELVGFSSYVLIGHYHQQHASGTSSRNAFILNRIGDVGFLIGLMILWSQSGTFDLTLLFANENLNWKTAASMCIFAGVVGKSAQFPLFTWLPDAMQGPTPVSALIHAATMVAAGVYLMVRVFPLFTEVSLHIVLITGCITAVIGALGALAQYDIKRILAFSTMSQLGLMMIAIGAGFPQAAFIHLFTHAFFKACLFLCAGSIIHSLHHAQLRLTTHFDVQDIRNLGGLRKKLPVTFLAFLLSAASLAGVPFFSGFVSKELMLTSVWQEQSFFGLLAFSIMVLVSFTTMVYTCRMLWYIFFTESSKTSTLEVEEMPMVMRLPVVILAVCSLWFIISWNPFALNGWAVQNHNHPISAGITLFSVLLVIVSFLVSIKLFLRKTVASNSLLKNSFYVKELYSILFRKALLPIADTSSLNDSKVIDRSIHGAVYIQVTIAHIIGWVDRTLVDGFVHFFAGLARAIGKTTRSIQGGKIQLYIFWATFAIIIFLICALN